MVIAVVFFCVQIETHQDGERVRYFEDDDGVDLREMVRREKMSTAEDQNALYSRMAGKVSVGPRTHHITHQSSMIDSGCAATQTSITYGCLLK